MKKNKQIQRLQRHVDRLFAGLYILIVLAAVAIFAITHFNL